MRSSLKMIFEYEGYETLLNTDLAREERQLARFLSLVAEAYNVKATGIDLSPYTIKAARENVAARGLADRIELQNVKVERRFAPVPPVRSSA